MSYKEDIPMAFMESKELKKEESIECRRLPDDKEQELRERMRRNHDMILELVQNAMQKPRREK